MDKFIILAAGNIRRHSIHVSGEDNVRRLSTDACVNIEPFAELAAFARLGNQSGLDNESAPAQEFSQEVAHDALAIGRRIDVHQLPGERNRVEPFHLPQHT